MTSADDVIADIDHALLDWSVSPDAMRWNPAPPPRQSRVQACVCCEGGISLDEDGQWRSTGDFGGTGTGALTEAYYCLDSPDHEHHVGRGWLPRPSYPESVARYAAYNIYGRR